MSLATSIQSHLDQLAQTLNTGKITLSSHGDCALQVNGITVIFQLEQKANALQLIAPVGELGEGDYQDLATALLQANLSWEDTRGCSLALDGEAETIILSTWIKPEHLDFPEFHNALELFICLALSWKKNLPSLFTTPASANNACPAETFILV